MPTDDACASTHLNDPDALLTAATAREVKLPTFCAAETVSLFQRAEIQFRLKRETSHTHMANHVLASLPQDVFLLISSWLLEQGDHLEYGQAQEASPSEVRRHARGTGDQTPGALTPTTGGSTSLCRLPGDEGADEGAAGGLHYPDVGPTTGLMAPATPGRCEKGHHRFLGRIRG